MFGCKYTYTSKNNKQIEARDERKIIDIMQIDEVLTHNYKQIGM